MFKFAGEKFVADSMGLLNTATSADEALSTADLVVEAVTENMALKQVCVIKISIPQIHPDIVIRSMNGGDVYYIIVIQTETVHRFRRRSSSQDNLRFKHIFPAHRRNRSSHTR